MSDDRNRSQRRECTSDVIAFCMRFKTFFFLHPRSPLPRQILHARNPPFDWNVPVRGVLPPPPPCLAISSSMNSFLIGVSESKSATAESSSCAWNVSSCDNTALASVDASNGQCRVTLKTLKRPMAPNTSGRDVVPMTSNFLPGGGALFKRISKACSTTLENRGPIATYSRRRSISSKTIRLNGLLYASSKTLDNAWHLFISL